MTINSLLRVMAIALAFMAACKSDFQAGINGNDGSAQEVAVLYDSSSPADSVPWSCDPFSPTTKAITLTNVLGAGRDADGTLYVVDQPQPGAERVFVSSGGTLQRQRVAGSGTESSGGGVMSYTLFVSDHVPPCILKLETNAAGPTAMGVLQGTSDSKTFTIGQQGSVLTLVPVAQVAALPAANIPAQTFIEYNATLSDGRALLVVRPRDDWTFQDFRVFFGAPDHMVERTVDQVVRYQDGGSTTINFTVDGVPAVASFPVSLTGVAAPPTLTLAGTAFPLILGPTDSPPAGESYFCLGNPPVDGGVDALSTPADGPATCRAPSPDYGPTTTFPVLPNGTPAAATTCSAACGASQWPQYGVTIDIALPYGACAAGTPSCSVSALVPCACEGHSGVMDAFNCSCEDGNWICRILWQGTAICLPCPDAGVANMDQAPASDGAQNADGASIGPTKPDGLNLAGLTAATVTTGGAMPGAPPYDACSTDDTNVYSLDFQTRVVNWEHCAIDPSTAAAYRKTETQLSTDYEVTAAQLMLELLLTDYNRTACGADKGLELLDLTFADRVEKYQDDFYAGCPTYAPVDGRTYLHYMDGIANWLAELSRPSPLPSVFDELTVTLPDSVIYVSTAASAAAQAACGYNIDPEYTVTSATRKLTWSSCVSPNGLTGYTLQTDNRILSEGEFALVMQNWSRIERGATGDCSTSRPTELLQVTPISRTYAQFVNDSAACNRDDNPSYSNVFVVGLDDLTALLVSLASATP